MQNLNQQIPIVGGLNMPAWQIKAGWQFGLRARYIPLAKIHGKYAIFLPTSWVKLCAYHANQSTDLYLVSMFYEPDDKITIDPHQ